MYSLTIIMIIAVAVITVILMKGIVYENKTGKKQLYIMPLYVLLLIGVVTGIWTLFLMPLPAYMSATDTLPLATLCFFWPLAALLITTLYRKMISPFA